MSSHLLLLATLLASIPSNGPELAPESALSRRIERVAAQEPGSVGVAVIHVESGETSGSNPSDRFPMASTYKVPIAAAVLSDVEMGRLCLDQPVTIRATDLRVGGSEGSLKRGQTVTIETLLERMIIESDNTATDLLLRVVGGPAAVSHYLSRQGIAGIDVSRSELELAADYSGVVLPKGQPITPAAFRKLARAVPATRKAAAEARFDGDLRDTASPEAMARVLVRLHKGELLPPQSTARLLALMTRCATGDARLRALLPKGTPVADKTGTIGRATHDVGIVTLPDGTHVAIAVYVKGSPRPMPERERVIAEIARSVWDHYAAGTPAKRAA